MEDRNVNRRVAIIAIGSLGLLVFIALGWFLASPLFIDNPVDEAFPFEVPTGAQLADMSEADRKELEADFMSSVPDAGQMDALSEEEQKDVTDKVMAAAAAVMMDKPMAEAPVDQAAGPWSIAVQGEFVDADSFHVGSGSATILQQDRQQILRLEDFSVTNGPDLHVILSTHPAPADRSEVGEDYVDLGSLKGNIGNQNYEIAAGIDLTEYQSIVIYCVPFHVVFATATLSFS
jgi:uncharacterized iron-regulated membrane protein